MEDELSYYKNQSMQLELKLDELQAELKEFQTASRELDEELEREIEQTEKAYSELTVKMVQQEMELDEWKTKYYKAQHERMAMVTMGSLWISGSSGPVVRRLPSVAWTCQ